MEKSLLSVINILPPRIPAFWDKVMRFKQPYFHNMRSGPHITMLDPFILPCHYKEGAAALAKVVKFVAID